MKVNKGYNPCVLSEYEHQIDTLKKELAEAPWDKNVLSVSPELWKYKNDRLKKLSTITLIDSVIIGLLLGWLAIAI